MNIRSLALAFLIIPVSNITRSDTPQKETVYERFFDTKFLQNYDTVRETLITQEGFEEVTFTTQDGVELTGLLLLRENAAYNVVSCAGFCPGRKEGMASLLRILPSNCNLLFFDARGHGQSKGLFWRNIGNYGVDEYKDVQAAVKYIRRRDDKKTLIHSICAGSFHALTAVEAFEKESTTGSQPVQGLIFDSGFSSQLDTMELVYKHVKLKALPTLLTTMLYKNDTKHNVQQRYLYKALWTAAYSMLSVVDWWVRPTVAKNEPLTNLNAKVGAIKTPIFYIHAKDDAYAPIEHVQKLADQTHTKETWWVDNSDHAINHLKHTQEYRTRMGTFIERLLV